MPLEAAEIPASRERHRDAGQAEAAPEAKSAAEIMPAQVQAAPVPVSEPKKEKTELEKKLDTIMEEDVKDAYLMLPEEKRVAFRRAGEETAEKIKGMIETAKLTAVRLLDLLKKWLGMLPVNHFFIEQIAKIKADKIFELARTVGIS